MLRNYCHDRLSNVQLFFAKWDVTSCYWHLHPPWQCVRCVSWSLELCEWVICVCVCVSFLTNGDKKCRTNAYFDLSERLPSLDCCLSCRWGLEKKQFSCCLLLAPPAHCVLTLKPHYKNACVALHLKQVRCLIYNAAWCTNPPTHTVNTPALICSYLVTHRHLHIFANTFYDLCVCFLPAEKGLTTRTAQLKSAKAKHLVSLPGILL